jgi:hypothetical protein
MSISRHLIAVVLFASFSSSGANALAQSEAIDPKSPPTKETNTDLLAGPEVEAEAAAGEGGAMGPAGGLGGRQPKRAENIPIRQWMQQVRALEGLTTEQQQDIAAVFSEFQRAQREYQQEHADEMRDLQAKIRQARESGQEPEVGLREQMQKLEADMPKPPDYQRRIWALLSSEQQEALRQRIAEMERRALERRRSAQASRDAEEADDEMMAGDQSADTDAKPGIEDKDGGSDEMMGDPEEPDRPNARGRMRERRRAAETSDSLTGLDDLARRRVEFLLQHISASSPARAGDAPSPAERAFKFEEDGRSETP